MPPTEHPPKSSPSSSPPNSTLPSTEIRALSKSLNTNPSREALQETIENALQAWHSGLLAHEHPTEPAALLNAFLELITVDEDGYVDWAGVDVGLGRFLQERILESLVSSGAGDVVNGYAEDAMEAAGEKGVGELLQRLIPLFTHRPSRPALALGIFLHLHHLHDRHPQAPFTTALLSNRPLEEALSSTLPRLLPHLRASLDEHTIDTSFSSNRAPRAIGVLQTVFTLASTPSLTRSKTELYALFQPLLSHPHAGVRVPAVCALKTLYHRIGAEPSTAGELRNALLWRDAETALEAVPLLCTLLPGLDERERVACDKCVVQVFTHLTRTYDGSTPCVHATNAAVRLLPCVQELGMGLLPMGEQYMQALAGLLERVSGLVGAGTMESMCVLRVCDGLLHGIRVCWMRVDGFRGAVMKACLVCLMELDHQDVRDALQGVMQGLAACNPARLLRAVRDVRASVAGFTSMGRVERFLGEAEERIVGVGEMREVHAGKLVARFFPELNEFNIEPG